MVARTEEQSKILRLAEDLEEAGKTDVLILDNETARKVNTEKRREVICEIKDGDIDSIRSLAESLDRNVSDVYDDLEILYESDVIEFEEEANRKKPKIAHETILPEPIIF